MKNLSNRITFDRICKLLGVDTWEGIVDKTPEFCQYNPELTEEENQKVEEDAADEAFRNYYDAVMYVADQVFIRHDLDLLPVKVRRKLQLEPVRPWEYRVFPRTSWEKSARELIETINGMGPFRFDTLKAFLSSGPYTPRQAVLSHLGWIPDWYDVYEGSKAKSRVEARLRY